MEMRGPRDDRIRGLAVAGGLVSVVLLAMMAVEVFTAEWRTPDVDFMTAALGPTTLVVLVLLAVAARRTPATACVLVTITLVVIVGVVLGAFAYEEWMETQPGGRGYIP